MNKIKAIFFDMDGVLIDAKDWHYEALNKALTLFGMEINRYDHLITYDGLPTRKKLEMLSMERGLPKELHEFINRLKQQFTTEQIYQKCKPLFIHEYAISKLKNEGFLLATCSNSIRKTMEIMLDKAMLLPYFEVIFSNEDVQAAKPDPEIYITCMKHLNMKPQETLILEDNEHGLNAAISSGAHVMKINNVNEVNYFNIKQKIMLIEKGEQLCSE